MSQAVMAHAMDDRSRRLGGVSPAVAALPWRLLEPIMDAVSAHVAVVGRDGTILAINEPWRRFAAANAYADPDCGVGVNYLAVCDRASRDAGIEGSEAAASVAGAIRQILSGRLGEFERDYPCHSPDVRRWFRVRLRRFDNEGQPYVLAVHENITELRLAQERYQQISRNLAQLKPRERQVLDLILAGRLNKQIAAELGLSIKTVEVHRARLMERMQAGSLPELVRMVLLVQGGDPASSATSSSSPATSSATQPRAD